MSEKQKTDLELVRNLKEEYEKIGLLEDNAYRFLCDVIVKLEKRKRLTPKQKSWLNSLLEKGIPDIDMGLVAQIERAINLKGMEHRVSPLRDFCYKIKKGWDLSPKQKAFMEGILQEAQKVEEYGPYIPSDEDTEKLRLCVLLAKGYSTTYWSTHPGTARSLNTVRSWLESPDENRVDEFSVNKIIGAMGAKLRELQIKPYVSPGDVVWCRKAQYPTQTFYVGIVLDNPCVSDRGEIVYSVLCDGKAMEFSSHYLAKRKPRV